MNKVSIIIPWLRPHLIVNVKKMAIENAGIPENEIELIEDGTRGVSINRKFNAMVGKTTGEYICFLADDCLPQPGYLKAALDKFKNGVKFVMMNDGTNTDRPGHFIFERSLLDDFGGKLAHEGYHHCYADNEIIDRTKEMGVYKWCKDALVIHNHPMLNKEVQMDEHYNRVYSKSLMNHDLALFCARKRAGFPRTDAGLDTRLKVAIGLPSLGEISTVTTRSLMYLFESMTRSGMNPAVISAFAPVDTARNLIVEKCLEMDCTHLLFIDSDAEFPANTAHVLLVAGKDVIGCNAAKKLCEEPVLTKNVHGEELNYIEKKIDEVTSIGMHATLIHTNVFKNMKPPWFYPVPYNDSPVLATEDLVFCKISKVKIYCHLEHSMQIGHVLFRDKVIYLEKHIRKQIEEKQRELNNG